MASVGAVRMRVTLGQRCRKDYALLNAERMVYISFVINAFKKNFCVLLLLLNFFTFLKNFFGFLVWRWFLKCGVSWSLEAPSDGYLLWLFSCGW